jgi:3-oxoacyl-[acyl-carrier protein] reductase
MTLEGKTAFVTGGGSGLGAAIATAFAREGARVLVTDIDEKAAAAVAKTCESKTAGSRSARCDVADSKSVASAFQELDHHFGGIDILVNNAGIVHRDPDYVAHLTSVQSSQVNEILTDGRVKTHWQAVEKLSDEMFDRMIKIHLYGTFYCTREALPRMRKQGRGGRIINMGSIMGSASLAGVPDYCAAKGAILAFTRATARESASFGVLINAIAPGFIDTPLLVDLVETSRRMIAMQTPLGRFGTVEEIAEAAVFLAGPSASFITGQTISPNGGIYMSQ